MTIKNYYETLGVSEQATSDEIKQAFRKLSSAFHPDKNNEDSFLEEMFKKVNEANEVLSNTEKRLEYDKLLMESKKGRSRKTNKSKEEQNTHSQKSQERGTGINLNKQFLDTLNLYFEQERITESKKDTYIKAVSIEKANYFSVTKLIIFAILVFNIHFYFNPEKEISALSISFEKEMELFEYETIEETDVLKKPYFDAEKIGKIPKGKGLNSIKETKYFLQIEFDEGLGNIQTGYISKKKVKKMELSEM